MMRSFFLSLTAGLTSLALYGCSGDDLVLPTDGSPGTGGGTAPATPDASLSTLSADPASIQVGSDTATIRVTVRDESGVPMPGVIVTLTAAGSGNRVEQPAAPTNADGVAIGRLSSDVAGTKEVSALVNGTLRLNQTAQVFVSIAPATRIEAVEGDDQRAAAGSAVALPPAVRVTDAMGQPVIGYGGTFAVTEGGGSVAGASQVTDGEGIARVGSWTLGAAGRNSLEARAGSLEGSPVVFNATATEEPPPPPPPATAKPDHFVFLEPPHDVEENEEFTVRVAIVDAAGSIVPLSGIEIYLGLFRQGAEDPSNTRLLGDRFRETRGGVAEFRLRITNGNFGSISGESERYRLRALSDELPELGPYGPEPFLYSDLFEVHGG